MLSAQVAFDIIEEELGQPLEKVFSRISSRTIAAASLGQVYRATLRETGEDVAIKVHSKVTIPMPRPLIQCLIGSCFLPKDLTSFFNILIKLPRNIITWGCLQVQRPGIEPIIYRDLFLFRTLASFLNGISLQKLGCNAELIVDEFGEKLLEELDYTLVLKSS